VNAPPKAPAPEPTHLTCDGGPQRKAARYTLAKDLWDCESSEVWAQCEAAHDRIVAVHLCRETAALRGAAALAAGGRRQGLQVVHFSAQHKHVL